MTFIRSREPSACPSKFSMEPRNFTGKSLSSRILDNDSGTELLDDEKLPYCLDLSISGLDKVPRDE